MAGGWHGRRRIGRGALLAQPLGRSTLDGIAELIDWSFFEVPLEVSNARPSAEAGWPPLAMFRALSRAVWHDLLGVELTEALGDQASFRRF